jgi:hypothetical protein
MAKYVIEQWFQAVENKDGQLDFVRLDPPPPEERGHISNVAYAIPVGSKIVIEKEVLRDP